MDKFILFGNVAQEDPLKHTSILGSRGIRAASLAKLDMPICPGFIITAKQAEKFLSDPASIEAPLNTAISETSKSMNKTFGSGKNLLFLKIIESPMLNIQSALPSIHHVGLTNHTIKTMANITGEKFAYDEYVYMLSLVLKINLFISDNKSEQKNIQSYMENLKAAKTKEAVLKSIETFKTLIPQQFYTDHLFQCKYIVQQFHKALKKSPTTEDSSLMVQAMVYGNMQKENAAGYFYTHDLISGEDKLKGEFFPASYDESVQGVPITEIDRKHWSSLEKIARKLEDHFKELRWVRFALEGGVLWLVDQSSVPHKSAQAEIRTLLDLLKRKVIDNDYIIQSVKPGRLSEILHPNLDTNSVKKFVCKKGGIAGAVGAAIGRVYFSAESLITAYRKAQQLGRDTNMILAMSSTFAGDVKAIEKAQGVLSSEGGYASHAPVVSRSLGKVAIVQPDAVFRKNRLILGNMEIKEGDYLTINVPYYEDPVIYIGKGTLIKPVIENSGIIDFLNVVQTRIEDVDVHANADQPRDAELAKKFNAQGIGLCRTEHMFFAESRINRFRYMILAEDKETRVRLLNDLSKDQIQDFYKLFKIMNDLPVTIRLLDAPLHEFLPHDKESMKNFIAQAKADNIGLTSSQIEERSNLLNEFNPMLGHRGVRVAISYPEIYQMQIGAIFEAAYRLKKKGFNPCPEIMIPLVMNSHELKVIRHGKRMEGKQILSIKEIENRIRKLHKTDPIEYSVGTMIELPASALDASELSIHADFFSFGTNDLTQTTYGLSRDDFNTFVSDYTELDLLPDNPFKVLPSQVKTLISMAALRGRMVRPDLRLGLCGEHGAEPQNIDFIAETGMNYVSVSPYGIPIAKLAIAQMNLKMLKN